MRGGNLGISEGHLYPFVAKSFMIETILTPPVRRDVA
jgi:hypothetical protein